jgi:hypothetical protein
MATHPSILNSFILRPRGEGLLLKSTRKDERGLRGTFDSLPKAQKINTVSLELPPSPAPPLQLVSYPRSTWLRKGSRPRGAPTFGSQRAPGRAPPANVRSKCTQAAPPSWTPECHYPHWVVISPFLALQGPVRFPLPWTRKGERQSGG